MRKENWLIRSAAAIALGLLILTTAPVHASDNPLPTPTPSPLGTAKTEGFGNESELGVILSAGNSPARSIHALQNNSYGWKRNIVKTQLRYYWAEARSVESARYWRTSLRYERELTDVLGAYVGQTIESDRFANYDPRYGTDIGGKYWIKKDEAFQWTAELGYRYSLERRPAEEDFTRNFLRWYTEVNYAFSKTSSVKFWIEYLPDIPAWNNYLLNSEFSVTAALTDVFALRTSYLVKYDNDPATTSVQRADSLLSSAIVAKF